MTSSESVSKPSEKHSLPNFVWLGRLWANPTLVSWIRHTYYQCVHTCDPTTCGQNSLEMCTCAFCIRKSFTIQFRSLTRCFELFCYLLWTWVLQKRADVIRKTGYGAGICTSANLHFCMLGIGTRQFSPSSSVLESGVWQKLKCDALKACIY